MERLGEQSARRQNCRPRRHNLAVAGERFGKLNLALEWAERAYLDFGNKRDQEYIHVLRMRINDERKVESQLKK
jgi:hypothetical protein